MEMTVQGAWGLPLDDIKHLIGVITGKEQFSPGITLRKVTSLIDAILDILYPVGTGQTAQFHPHADSAEDAKLLMVLSYVGGPGIAQGDDSVAVAGLFDNLPVPREVILNWLLAQLFKWLEKNLASNLGSFFSVHKSTITCHETLNLFAYTTLFPFKVCTTSLRVNVAVSITTTH